VNGMSVIVFVFSLLAILVIAGAGLASAFIPSWRFWPPPTVVSVQYRLFWWPFRVYFVGLVTLSAIEFTVPAEGTRWWRLGLGVPFFLIGFGLALYGTSKLGWANARGAQNGLETTGMYQWSRNPIYVMTIVGLVGLGLMVHSHYVYILSGLWVAMYVAAPFYEEPWLEERYGEEYRDYRRSVHRFFGRTRF